MVSQPAYDPAIGAALETPLTVKLQLNATQTFCTLDACMRAEFIFRDLRFQSDAADFPGVNALQEFPDVEADESLKNRNFRPRQS
jgi:hypothetical protein